MNSISNLSSPISEGFFSSRFFKKPIVATVAIALTIIVALGIYFFKRSGYSLVCPIQIQNRPSGQFQNSSHASTLSFQTSPTTQTSQTTWSPPTSTRTHQIMHQERVASLPTPVLKECKYQDIEIDVPFQNETKMTVPGAVIDFAEQAEASHIQRLAPNLWMIDCHSKHGYFIYGDGKEHDRCTSPTPHRESPNGASRQILLEELLAQVQRQ